MQMQVINFNIKSNFIFMMYWEDKNVDCITIFFNIERSWKNITELFLTQTKMYKKSIYSIYRIILKIHL